MKARRENGFVSQNALLAGPEKWVRFVVSQIYQNPGWLGFVS
jgi:hypothetical protein